MIILLTPENVKGHTTGQQRPIFNCSLQLRLTVDSGTLRHPAHSSTVHWQSQLFGTIENTSRWRGVCPNRGPFIYICPAQITQSYAANIVDFLTSHELVMKTYNCLFLANPTDRKWNPLEHLGSALELHWIPFPVRWICLEQTIILPPSPANAIFVPIYGVIHGHLSDLFFLFDLHRLLNRMHVIVSPTLKIV